MCRTGDEEGGTCPEQLVAVPRAPGSCASPSPSAPSSAGLGMLLLSRAAGLAAPSFPISAEGGRDIV